MIFTLLVTNFMIYLFLLPVLRFTTILQTLTIHPQRGKSSKNGISPIQNLLHPFYASFMHSSFSTSMHYYLRTRCLSSMMPLRVPPKQFLMTPYDHISSRSFLSLFMYHLWIIGISPMSCCTSVISILGWVLLIRWSIGMSKNVTIWPPNPNYLDR